MPMPPEIAQASKQSTEQLGALKDRAFLQTHNQCYAMLRAVLHAFRGYMTVAQAIAFAGTLPPVARAFFVVDWRPEKARPPPPSLGEFTEAVVRRLSQHHIPPDSITTDVFTLLVERMEPSKAARGIEVLPADLQRLWRGGN